MQTAHQLLAWRAEYSKADVEIKKAAPDGNRKAAQNKISYLDYKSNGGNNSNAR